MGTESHKDALKTKLADNPSWFIKTSQQYQIVVESLLSEAAWNASNSPDTDALANFKRIYRPTAFVCGSHRCPRSSRGFESSSARDEHEISHKIRYICPDSKCVFTSAGFPKFNLLQKHIQQYHSKPEDDVPLLSKQRLPKKRRFEDPEDYTFAPTFLLVRHHPDVLQQRLWILTKAHSGHPKQSTSRIFLDHKRSFPLGPSARGLAPKKAFLDFDEIRLKQTTWNRGKRYVVDLQPLVNSLNRTPIISERWKIPELNSFHDLLENFGSDWESIASVLKTKTALMIINHYDIQVDPGKTEYEELVNKADKRRAANAGKVALQDEELLDPAPTIKDQPQRIYDPYSISLVVRTAPPHTSSSGTSTNHIDGPFVGVIDRNDSLAGVLPDINLLSPADKDFSEAVENFSDLLEARLGQIRTHQWQTRKSNLRLRLKLRSLLQEIKELNSSWPYFYPVHQYEVTDYYDIVRETVDFRDLQAKIEEARYNTSQEIFDDVALMFEDRRMYNNQTTSDVRGMIKDYMLKLSEISEISSRGDHALLSSPRPKEQPDVPSPDPQPRNQKDLQNLHATDHASQKYNGFESHNSLQTHSDEQLEISNKEKALWDFEIPKFTQKRNLQMNLLPIHEQRTGILQDQSWRWI